MSTVFSPHPPQAPAPPAGRRPTAWLWLILAGAVGAGTAWAVLPTLLPALIGAATGTAPQVYWYISRAAAFVAYILLWLSMLAGLGITSKLARTWPGLPTSFEVHRFASLLGLGFAVVHALVLLGDQYINYTLGQVLVPFMAASYRPAWVGFGQVALYMLGVVAVSFYVRDRLGLHAWRLIHALSFALFLMALIHGWQSGTNSHDGWALAIYGVSAASVLFGSVYRVLAVRLGRPKTSPAAAGLVATAGQAQRPPPPVPVLLGRSSLRRPIDPALRTERASSSDRILLRP